MHRVARGDTQALRELYDRHAERLLKRALRITGDFATAEDVVQDVLLDAWRKAATYDASRSSVFTWLSMRVRSRAIDVQRQRAVRRATSFEDHFAASDDPSQRSSSGRGLATALSRLGAPHQAMIVGHYRDGMTMTELAAWQRIPVGTAKSRMAAAMGRLRGMMSSAPRPMALATAP